MRLQSAADRNEGETVERPDRGRSASSAAGRAERAEPRARATPRPYGRARPRRWPGLQVARGATPRQAIVPRPWHRDCTPSCSVRLAKDGTIAVRCHACGATGDALTPHRESARASTISATCLGRGRAGERAPAPPLRRGSWKPRGEHEKRVSDETYATIWTWTLDAPSPLRVVAPHVAAYLDQRRIASTRRRATFAGFRPMHGNSCAVARDLERAHLETAAPARIGRSRLARVVRRHPL